VLKIENKQSELQKTKLKKDSKKFGASEIKLDICNRFKREVQQK
jgi:hypothetical protein